MPNHNHAEEGSYTKRRKIISAVVEDTLNSEEDEIDLDSMGLGDHESTQYLTRSESSGIAIYALGETIRNTLLEINEIREQNRERRHKELLDTLSQIMQNDGEKKTPAATDTEIETDTHHSDHDKASTICYIVVDGENACKQEIGSTMNEMYGEKTSCTTKMLKMESHSVDEREGSTPKQNKNLALKCRKPLQSEEDFKSMRVKMLEMHRRKMEDRESKKRACLQAENV